MSAEQPTNPLTRMRITYGKAGALRYVGNLDMHTVWERTLRRARLPLAYTQGYSPRPRFQLASSLPMGVSSRCELMDVWLAELVEAGAMLGWLRQSAPPGLEIVAVTPVDLKLPALQTVICSAEYRIAFKSLPAGYDLIAAVKSILEATSLPRTWREKPYDLRALIEDLRVLEPDTAGRPQIAARLAAREGATGRPEELLAAFGLGVPQALIERTDLYFR